jgi:putative peptide zinc metalloprotease protein
MAIDTPIHWKSLLNVCLQIRPTLRLLPRSTSHAANYVIVEDTDTGRFFRLGRDEQVLLGRLNGKTRIDQALKSDDAQVEDPAKVVRRGLAFFQWLNQMGWLTVESSKELSKYFPSSNAASQTTQAVSWNPLSFRLPFISMDQRLRPFEPFSPFFFSRCSLIAWCLLVAASLVLINRHHREFLASSFDCLTMANSGVLALVWLALKAIHEFGHALACQRYGGQVKQCGIQISWFFPMPFVDVTSCWRFPERWQRMVVTAAGVYFELAIAGIATLVWSMTSPGQLHSLSYQVILMAGISTAIFNLNPLMKMDGYYLLADWLDIPNLYAHGQRSVTRFFERFVLGLPVSRNAITNLKWKAYLIISYGWLSLFWRTSVGLGMLIVLAKYFGQFGLVAAVALGFLWLGPGVRRLVVVLINGRSGLRVRMLRLASLVFVGMMAIGSMAVTLPWPGNRSAVGIVDFQSSVGVRASGHGRIDRVYVRQGEVVQSGQQIATQQNLELESKAKRLQIQLKQSEIRERQFLQKSQVAEQQAEHEHQRAIQAELTSIQLDIDQLQICAKSAGIVNHPDPASLEGRFFEIGDEILQVIPSDEKIFRASISQSDFDYFQNHLSNQVTIDLPGREQIEGRLRNINPRASLVPLNLSLIQAYGGSLAARKTQSSNHSRQPQDQAEDYELNSPALEAIVELDPSHSRSLFAGQRGRISFHDKASIATHLWERWLSLLSSF